MSVSRFGIMPTDYKWVTFKATKSFEWLWYSAITSEYVEIQLHINDLYDPFGSIGSYQPQGYTELFNMYKYGVVKSASVSITMMEEPHDMVVAGATPNDDMMRMYLWGTHDSATPTEASAGTEILSLLPFMKTKVRSWGTQGKSFRISNSWDMKKIFGFNVVPPSSSSSAHWNTVNTSPTSKAYARLAGRVYPDSQEPDATRTISTLITMKQKVLFFRRNWEWYQGHD